MGFFEIFLVLIVAIIALGPEKLPGAAVEIVRFFKKFKSGVEEAKSTIDQELNISEMKKEAEQFKASVDNVTSTISADIDEVAQITESDIKESTSFVDEEKKKKKELKAKKEEKSSKKENITFDQGES
jgi:sec-independent protein translocase protein TatB